MTDPTTSERPDTTSEAEVVNLDARRPEQTEGFRRCTCGCAYFTTLHLTINDDYTAAGYAYPAKCADCGKELVAP